MIASKTPLGSLILYTYQDKSDLGGPVMSEKVENLIDLIKYRAESKGISEVLHSLKEELFEIRFEYLRLLSQQNEYLHKLDESLIGVFWEKLNSEKNDPLLNKSFLESLNLYSKICNSFGTRFGDKLKSTDIETAINQIPSYRDFVFFFDSLSLKSIRYFLDRSLEFDLLLITAELNFSQELKLQKKQKAELSKSLLKTSEEFGYYAALTGFFTPDDQDEDPLTRNIKIRIAKYEVENHNSSPFSIQSLKEILPA